MNTIHQQFDIAGRSRGITYDAINVSGTANLAGSINVLDQAPAAGGRSPALRDYAGS